MSTGGQETRTRPPVQRQAETAMSTGAGAARQATAHCPPTSLPPGRGRRYSQHVPSGVVGDPGFVGRGDELAAISARAADVAGGRPWVVWIEGDAGVGKTALLRQAVSALPSGFQLLRAEASELAGDVPFDLICQLGEIATTAPFPAAMATLGLWGRAAHGGPVAVAVEDLHWADAESRLALLTAARRLREDPVLLLVTSRPGAADADGWERLRLDSDRCLHVALGPLSPGEVAELAARRGVTLTAAAADRLVRHTGGHPLYVRTMLTEIPVAALTSAEGELPAPRSLAATTAARVAGFPADARRLIAALAVLSQPASLQLLAQVAGLSGAASAADTVLSSGLVGWRAGEPATLEFAHPLYQAAVYADLAPSVRQELHRRASVAVGGAAALGHRVAAADCADDELAGELERAAAAEAASHHLGQAAGYLLWAAQLSSSPAMAQTRLLRAARLRLAAGQSPQVEPLRARLEACDDQPLRSLVLGVLAWERGDAIDAEQLLRAAVADGRAPAQAPGAPAPGDAAPGAPAPGNAVTADALARLAFLLIVQIRAGEAAAAAKRALEIEAAPPDSERTAWYSLALAEAVLHGPAAALACITARLPQPAAEVTPADVDLLIYRGTLRMYALQWRAAAADFRGAIKLAGHGPSLQLPRAHLELGQALFNLGNWDEAIVQGRVAVSLISDERTTWQEAQAHGALVEVLAARGDWDGAREHLAACQRLAESTGNMEGLGYSLSAQSYIAAAGGRPDRVVELLSPRLAGDQEEVNRISTLGWWALLITALIDTAALDAAATQIDALTAAAAARPMDMGARLTGLRARLHARAGQPDEAAAAFARALETQGHIVPYLQAALLHHDYGRFLLARGDRKDGLAELMRARTLLASVGAVPYLERLDADLAQAGVRSPAPAGSPAMALTEREADVVALVSKGMTNGEVAAQLYVSVNTVEYHLRNVFAKLGVKSRRELRARSVAVG
jgi:DNA-binding CsgD family transcriptional regulator